MQLIDLVIKHEGLRLTVYDDATGKPIVAGSQCVGNPTLGVGRELSKTGISDAEARELLKNDIVRFSKELDKALPWWRKLTENRQQVIFSMAFNMGIAGLLGFKNTLKSIQDGNYEAGATQMLESKWSKQVGKRAVELAEMMRLG